MRIKLAAALLLGFTDVAAAQTLTINAVDCSRLVRHVPAPDVAYRPGVDVQGRPVAPADLDSGPQIVPPETITFDVAVDLRRFGIPATSPLYQPNVALGKVAVAPDGQVSFNGQLLQGPELAALTELCRRRGMPPR